MAASTIKKTVFGDLRVSIMSMTMDAASGNIDTGLSKVFGFSLGIVSAATAAMDMKMNIGSGATSRPGFINVDAAATGDVFIVTVYGV